MWYYALVALAGGLIAGALDFNRVAAAAIRISWILFLIAIVLWVIPWVTGRTIRDS